MEEQNYLNLLKDVLENGNLRQTRNAITKSVFCRKLEFDLSESNIPLLTTKKVSFRNIFYELKWFLSGSTNTKHLNEKNVKIWNANGSRKFLDSQGFSQYPEGILGPIYGHQFCNNGAEYISTDNGFNQIKYVQDLIKNDPNSRRICMTVWAPYQLKEMALLPCHGSFIQYYVNNGRLDCYTHQRSCDLFLGCPYNIVSYSLLTMMMAKTCDLLPGRLHYSFGDVHLYENQFDAVKIQIERKIVFPPTLKIKQKRENVSEYEFADFEVENYLTYETLLPKVTMIA